MVFQLFAIASQNPLSIQLKKTVLKPFHTIELKGKLSKKCLNQLGI
jgi:hypothetical protein